MSTLTGGIVTFTPEAIIENYPEVLKKIWQLHDHPLWDCYLLPSVLGMVLQVTEKAPAAMLER